MSQILETMNDKISMEHTFHLCLRESRKLNLYRSYIRDPNPVTVTLMTPLALQKTFHNISDSNNDSVLTRVVTDKRTKRSTCRLLPFTGEGNEKWSVQKSCFETSK